jgi:D-arabinose 1-dehydrogenase-like Zn-dependent alcohol dehydrogenase
VFTTDLHILKGHWAKPLPWPFTLGHELGSVTVECAGALTEDFMGRRSASSALGRRGGMIARRRRH